MPWPTTRRLIGTKIQRLDGVEKATGRAKYAFDIKRPRMLFAKVIRSPHAHATIKSIDTAAAEKVAGYRALYQIKKAGASVFFAGDEILAIAADTEEHLEDCVRAVRIEYTVQPHAVREDDALRSKTNTTGGPGGNNINAAGDFSTDNFENAFNGLAATHQADYGVGVISHQCLESHGLVAEWDAKQENLTVWASTQAVPNTAEGLRVHFKLKPGQVKCITNYMGGGFGSKFGPDIQGIAAAELARTTRQAVKLMLDRAEEVTVGGIRPSAYGNVKIGATKEGQIRAYEVECHGTGGISRGATVSFAILPYVYGPAIPNIKRRHRVARTNIQIARAMRAPNHPQNSILTELAIDDLAARLNINPMTLRLANLPPNDQAEAQANPRTFVGQRATIYRTEIEIIRKMCGWDRAWHAPGQGGKGVVKTGLGMALHTWGGGGRGPNPTRVTINQNGTVVAQSSSQDLGTAQRTVTAIIVAEILGLQPTDITVNLGDSSFGPSTPSGGSTTCPGTSPAILKAAETARDAFLTSLAGRLNVQRNQLSIAPGVVVNMANNQRIPFRQACGMLNVASIQGNGDWPTQKELQGNAKLREEWTTRLSNQGVGGVQIAEVKVDTETGVVKCSRFWAVQDCGLIINKLACESQVAGGVIMGLNYALYEECIYDRATGRQVNPNMEFYKLAGIADMPSIKVHMHDMPERGVIGIGEPPTIATAAAVGNAIFNATGVRVPIAPYTPERVLAALANRRAGNG
ncbi:MAG: xanthine dehydrogenase family protein molybdopterin-binding subunit [Planctomycetes bacterium]|nr:xanthine dehydrogenase family protein molybdopterin-binding subunit [Planctomycetota bacterium]